MTRLPRRTLIGCLLTAVLVAPAASALHPDSARFKVLGVVIVWAADGADPTTANAPIASDFVIDSGSGGTAAGSGDADLIAGDVFTVVTGSLVPVSNGIVSNTGTPMIIRRPTSGVNVNTDTNGDGLMTVDDAFGAFGIRNSTDTNTRRAEITSSFYVASNTAFFIDGQATPVNGTTAADLDDIRLTLSTTVAGNDGISFGTAAQSPHTAGASGGSRANGRRLSSMIAARSIFEGNQRTAAARGTIAAQSVRFDLLYRYRSGNIDLSDGTFDAEAEVVYTVFIP